MTRNNLKETALLEFALNVVSQKFLTKNKLLKLIDSDTWRFFNFEVWYYCEFQNDWITYLKERNRK